MFQEWGFLLGEIWVLLLLAALLGLLAGWLIWGGRTVVVRDSKMQAEVDRLKSELEACQTFNDVKALPKPERAEDLDFDEDGIFEGMNEGTRPEALAGPRDGISDDLKLIKGIGPQMEALCNKLGFYHFDQISSWTTDEVAWVDANLEGFRGRVTRDKWVRQAKILARGGSTEFSSKVKKGDIQY